MRFEPTTVRSGSATLEYELAPGVYGYAVEENGAIYIPAIHAKKEGPGDVGRFLDGLTSRCRIANCVSARLRGMLERRMWKMTEEIDPVFNESVDVWIHPDSAPFFK